MRVFDHFSLTPGDVRGGVVVIGNFDGVHLGHQAVIGAGQAIARERKIPCGVLTFEPHPKLLFKPASEPFRLTPPEVKARLIERLGIDFVAAQRFDRAFAGLSALDFVTKVLKEGLGAVHVVVGYDFVFGKGREGDAEALQRLGAGHGLGVTCVGPVKGEDDQIYSSTRTRDALRQGNPRAAAAILGRCWEIEGAVIKGDQRGRTIGFPTANLGLGDYVRPAFGVYAVHALQEGETVPSLDGVANIGLRPTFHKTEPLLEAHLFDFSDDLYGRTLRVRLVEFVRPERKFDGIAALKAQITEDSRTARAILAKEARSDEPTRAKP